MRFLTIILATLTVMIMGSNTMQAGENHAYKTAIVAGGCFWCIETDFEKLDGVVKAVSGYAGGDRPNPTYQNYNKPSGDYKIPHIEVIAVTYDPTKLSYEDILNYHMRHIDPTDGEGQFCDRGAGYIPAIFVKNNQERQTAQHVLQETAKILNKDIKVKILDDAPFTAAEDYHQDYSKKNPVRYKFYRWNCGRDQTIAKVWGKDVPDNVTLNE